MLSSTLLRLLKLLNARPDGVSREELQCLQGIPPDWFDRALGKLLAAGVVEEKGERFVPLPALGPLARKMELLAARLNGQAQWAEACDLEALLYMFPRTMQGPLSEQWTRIYLYLGTKVLGEKFPEDIRQESLSQYDMGELRDLKRWLHKQKVKARKERREGKKVEAVVPVKVEQPKMF